MASIEAMPLTTARSVRVAALLYRLPTGVFLTDRAFTVPFGTGSHAAPVQLDL